MSERIKLTGAVILEAYCHLRQIERAVDAAISAGWSEYRDYYVVNDKTRLNAFVARLGEFVARPGLSGPIEAVNFCRFKVPLLSSILNRIRSRHAIRKSILQQVAIFLAKMNEVILGPVPPSVPLAVGLMAEASELRFLIEENYRGMRGLRDANDVEHWYRTETLISYSVDKIIEINSGASKE